MSKPLVGAVQHDLDSKEFHRAVFAAHGSKCYFRGPKYRKVRVDLFTDETRAREPHERCQGDATDAMHIIPRSELGAKRLRFAEPGENGRPGCRPCHMLQEARCIEFAFADRHAAWAALNPLNKVPLREPLP